MNLPDDSYKTPFTATVNGSVVVLMGVNAVGMSMSPEAILASLEPMRAAAEQALRNRRTGILPTDAV